MQAGTAAETTVESETFDTATAETSINDNLDNTAIVVDSVSEEQVEDTTLESCQPGTFGAGDACTECSQGATPITTYSVTLGSTSADD